MTKNNKLDELLRLHGNTRKDILDRLAMIYDEIRALHDAIKTLHESIKILKLKADADAAIKAACKDRGYYGTKMPERSKWCPNCCSYEFGKHPTHPIPSEEAEKRNG